MSIHLMLGLTETAVVIDGEEEAAPSPSSVSYRLGFGLAVVSAVSAELTFFVDGILLGAKVSQGSARGTALVVMVVGVPALVAGMIGAARGSSRALVVWLGATAYLLYNAVMFLFATPFNRLFLLYVAMLSLAVWSIVTTLAHTDVNAWWSGCSTRLPVRGIAVYTWVVVGVNFLVWMRAIVGAIGDPRPSEFLDDAGLTTNPVNIQDLAVWLPLMAVAGWWLWKRWPLGALVTATVLTMWVIESVSIAADQWFGHRADPTNAVADSVMVPVFAVLAAIGLVPVIAFMRNLDARHAQET
jgi:hypothetical protein